MANKTKLYLIVYDIDGDVCLAKANLTEDEAQTVKCSSSVYQVRLLPLANLEELSAEEALSIESEL